MLLAAGATPPDPYVTMLQLESQRSLGNGALARFLVSDDETIATRAALAIGRTKQPAGEALLVPHLTDKRVAVRAMAVYAIGLLTTGKQSKALITATRDDSGAVRVAALDALARYQALHVMHRDAAEAQKAIESVLAGDSDQVVRARAATALSEFHSAPDAPDAASALVNAFLTDKTDLVRWHAMWAIYRGFAKKVHVSLIERALKYPSELVRIEAVRAIAQYKDPKLVAVVTPLLNDSSWRVQEQAHETILILEGKPPTEHLKTIASSVHVPAAQPDPLAALPALPPPADLPAKPAKPTAARAIYSPKLDPATTAGMTEPAPGEHPRMRIVTTKGNIYVTLYPEWAPLTVENFMNLAAWGYFSNNRWFRIVPDFVVQTGDKTNTGDGDAGYTIGAEENPLEQRSYIISMGMDYDDKTHLPKRDSAGTQYYITLSPQLHLDKGFSVFGEVSSGFDVLGRLDESDKVIRIERIQDVNVPQYNL